MRGRATGLACFVLVCVMALSCMVTPVQAQPITFTGAGATGRCDVGLGRSMDCSVYDGMRYLYPVCITNRTTGIDILVIAINVEGSYFTAVPFALSLHGNPSSKDAPLGIPPYDSPEDNWWAGTPTYSEVSGLSQAVAANPANPVPGVGTWLAFPVQLMGDSLAGSGFMNLLPTFLFESDATGHEVLGYGVNGFATGVITVPTATFRGEAMQAETTFYYDIPRQISQVDKHKMHFPQYPDTFGIDINFTDPKVLADDWQCTETGPVDIIKFWFSAKNDWFDIEDPWSQISKVHVSIHADIPDPDGDGPLYSMPGDSLWVRDFDPYSPFITFREFYPDGDQGWYDPNTGEYILSDHTHIYECVIQNIQDYFSQDEGTIYWLDLSVTTIATPAGDSLLGWKTADMWWYPAQYSGRHFQDDAVWGDFPYPVWDELRDPADPDSGESLDLAFLISSTAYGTCWDWYWGWDEWCMHDCHYVTGSADGSHDCEVDLMDLCIFAQQYGMGGSNLSCDLDGDGLVDLGDFVVFQSHYGLTVPGCIPGDNVYQDPPEAGLHISFSPDPHNIQTYIAGATPGLYTVYVVADQMTSAVDGLDFGVVSSHPGSFLSGFTPSSPFTLLSSSTMEDISVASGSPVTGAVVVGSAPFLYTGDPTVSFDIAANTMNGNLRSVSVTDTSYREMAATSGGHIYLDPSAGVGAEPITFKNRLHSTSPNPFDRSTLIRYELARKGKVTIAIFDVTGQVVNTLVDLAAQDAGPHSIHWDGCDEQGREVAPGVYFYRMKSGGFEETRRVTHIR